MHWLAIVSNGVLAARFGEVSLALLVASVALARLDDGLGLLRPVLLQGLADIVLFTELPLHVAPYIAAVAFVRSNAFALGHLTIP